MSGGADVKRSYVRVWEFLVAPERVREFMAAYGPSGAWASLFRRSPGYVETLLLEDEAVPGRFVTIDRWSSSVAFDTFRVQFQAEYEALDRACEALTQREASLGACWELAPAAPPELRAGAYYTIDNGTGVYQVVKLLVVDDEAVHIRLYKNAWPARPAAVDVAELYLGSPFDSDGFSMGHMPFTRKSFLTWRPVFVVQGEVREEELKGYRDWEEAEGGLFGEP